MVLSMSSSSSTVRSVSAPMTTSTSTNDDPGNYPTGDTVPFPHAQPYPQQVAFMNALLQGIRDSQGCPILCLESPTGTGKSLSLACASLAWLDYMTLQDEQEASTAATSTVTPTSTTSTTSSTGLSWLDDWQPTENQDQVRQKELVGKLHLEEQKRQLQLQQYLAQIPKDKERRENQIRQAITKAKVQARKRQRTQPKIEYQDDDDNDLENTTSRSHRRPPQRGSPLWLLEPLSVDLSLSSSSKRRRQIIYAARTHSQLSQFIGEVSKTKWATSVRVVALGSRSQGLCGYLSKSKKISEAALTEQCLDLRQSKKRSGGSSTCACPFYQPDAIATLALHSLSQPTDIEEMVQFGHATQTCAYYATRQALNQAQLVVVPYSLLLDATTRKSVGLQLEGNLVLVDEAHNLPQAIEGLQSARVSLQILQAALAQVERYTNKYLLEQDRLNARHGQLLGQLKTLIKGFQKSLKATTTTTTSNESSGRASKTLLSISEYLCQYRLESINLFPLLRYMKESRLSQKLLGFMKDKNDKTRTTAETVPSAAASSSDTTTTTTTLSSHISPMSIVESFLTKINTFEPQHAKLIVSADQLELVVLNPAVHAQDDLYRLPHAVCLVGGTLQPLPTLMQELIPHLAPEASKAQALITKSCAASNNKKPWTLYQSPSFVGFSCDHVVSKDHVLLQAMTRVGNTTLDIRHSTRSLPTTIQAIGSGLLNVCRTIPHGMVVFLPSYSYEQVLIQGWKTIKVPGSTVSIWDALAEIKPLFREPKLRTEMEATLQQFSQTAEATRRGALLFAVVGGKLSEGINFANRLCRCVVVVGLPYADKSDPVLQEKLRYLQQGGSGAAASQQYYQSLCLRAVNQSVGRAIRHAKDYAAIVLMDARYPRDVGIATGLPQWLTLSTPNWRQQEGTMENVVRQLRAFFANPKFRDE